MSSMHKLILMAATLIPLAYPSNAGAAFTFVGSWDLATVGGGYGNPTNPYLWTNNPTVYSAVEAAAFLFGGSPSDYAISTIDSNPLNINHLAFVDGWGDSQYLYSPASETFSLDTGAPGYNDPYGGPAYSALVTDHAPGAGSFINYAFRIDSAVVPEPSSVIVWSLLGLAAAGGAWWRRRSVAA